MTYLLIEELLNTCSQVPYILNAETPAHDVEPAAHSPDLNQAKSQNYTTGPRKLAHDQNEILRRAYDRGSKRIVR